HYALRINSGNLAMLAAIRHASFQDLRFICYVTAFHTRRLKIMGRFELNCPCLQQMGTVMRKTVFILIAAAVIDLAASQQTPAADMAGGGPGPNYLPPGLPPPLFSPWGWLPRGETRASRGS